MDINSVGTFIICIVLLFIIGKVFIWPLKKILKLVFNSILGGLLIYIINIIGMNFGFHIGLNLLTSILVGILGIPGAILLVFLKIIIRVNINKKIKFVVNNKFI
jgi:inhibitor of the pro-sigma K processing machinery